MATKVLLVTMAGYPMVPSNFMPDNGLAQLAATLLEEGHDVKVVDLNTPELMDRLFPKELRTPMKEIMEKKITGDLGPQNTTRLDELEQRIEDHREKEFYRMGKELAELVKAEKTDWVGFKLWNGDGFSGSNQMAKAMKVQLPDIPIIAGGSQVDFFNDFLLEVETGFDFFSLGEGEHTVVEFSRFVEGNTDIKHVPNIFFRKNGHKIHTETLRVKDLNALPLPIYDKEIYPSATNQGKFQMSVYEETRGCPHRCAFCNHPLKAGHQMRLKNVVTAVNEMIELKKRYHFFAFRLGGSYTPSKYLRELAKQLIESQANIEFSGYGRISDAEDADFELFYKAGCRSLFFGVESGNQIILDKANKGYESKHCANILKASRKAGIFTITSLMFPNPGETDESRRETLRLIEDVKPDGVPILFPLLLPGSKWWDDPEACGFQVPDRNAYLHNLVNYKARLVYPPRFWPEMLYRIDNKPFHQFATESEEIAKDIEAKGPVTRISDEIALLALRSGLSVREFGNYCRWCFLTGNADEMQQLIDKINPA